MGNSSYLHIISYVPDTALMLMEMDDLVFEKIFKETDNTADTVLDFPPLLRVEIETVEKTPDDKFGEGVLITVYPITENCRGRYNGCEEDREVPEHIHVIAIGMGMNKALRHVAYIIERGFVATYEIETSKGDVLYIPTYKSHHEFEHDGFVVTVGHSIKCSDNLMHHVFLVEQKAEYG